MRKKNRKPPCRKIVLRLPDLDQVKSGVTAFQSDRRRASIVAHGCSTQTRQGVRWLNSESIKFIAIALTIHLACDLLLRTDAPSRRVHNRQFTHRQMISRQVAE